MLISPDSGLQKPGLERGVSSAFSFSQHPAQAGKNGGEQVTPVPRNIEKQALPPYDSKF